jgi:hypothetical protein
MGKEEAVAEVVLSQENLSPGEAYQGRGRAEIVFSLA